MSSQTSWSCDGLYWRVISKRGQYSSYLSAYEDGTECSETSAYKIRTPGNYKEESIQHSEQGESLKSKGGNIRLPSHSGAA